MNDKIVLETGKIQHSMQVQNPFIACMYHKDQFPKGNEKMEPVHYIEGRQIGNDFNPDSPWRMYHGENIPGFPVHPHRGFETITVVCEGTVDHADGLGASGRYGSGDVQWMTAGAGLQHTEMFPLISQTQENPLELFQIWLNLPASKKFADPHYKMLWNEQIPVITETDANGVQTQLRLIAGRYKGITAPDPNPDSWAADDQNHVNIWLLTLAPNAQFTIPVGSKTLGRMLYFYKGDQLWLEDTKLKGKHYARVSGAHEIHLRGGDSVSNVLLLEGEPINEPVTAYGPFVMNTREEVIQAYEDYRQTRFGGWPWPDNAPVHPRDSGRFARYANSEIERPPKPE